MKPAYQDRRRGIALYQGDCLKVLPTLESGSIDAVVTDPPYSSGGLFRGDRMADPAAKYEQSGNTVVRRRGFSGDNRDQRSWLAWCVLWMSECTRIIRPGGYLLCFTDWRQLPTCTDALQAAGFIWRGLIAWDKGPSARAANTSYFRHQCEYIVWGTNGPNGGYAAKAAGPWNGCYTLPVNLAEKCHLAGKPVKLMRELISCCPPDGTVLDPFSGSFTTGLACLQTGRRFIGIEQDPGYCEIGKRRLAAA